MSISLYYTAERSSPLTEYERDHVVQLVNKYNEPLASSYIAEKAELFHLYDIDAAETRTILDGATKLPYNQRIVMKYLEQWCKLLSDIRNFIPDSKWTVSVDDHEILWDLVEKRFDPLK